MNSEPRAPTSNPSPTPPSKLGDRIFHALIVVCACLFVADGFYHKHSHFVYEQWFGFQALMGFGAYVMIVNTAKLLRRLVKRSEDYYDE